MRTFLSRQKASIEILNKVNQLTFPISITFELRFQLSRHISITQLIAAKNNAKTGFRTSDFPL